MPGRLVEQASWLFTCQCRYKHYAFLLIMVHELRGEEVNIDVTIAWYLTISNSEMRFCVYRVIFTAKIRHVSAREKNRKVSNVQNNFKRRCLFLHKLKNNRLITYY